MFKRRTLDGRRRSQRGSALLGSLVVFVSLLGLLYAAGAMSSRDVVEARAVVEDVRAKYLAEAGVQRGINFLGQAAKNDFHDPLKGLTGLFTASATITPFVAQSVFDGGKSVGSYTVRMSSLQQTLSSVTIAIEATGYLPTAVPTAAGGKQNGSWHSERTIVKYSLAPSQVFDYAYFINNWGWFYGDSIIARGNVRSNGQFDAAGYSPTITGQPLYDSVSWNGTTAQLSGYHDDNGDGLNDGKDGGVFAGWDITNAQNVRGVGGKASNQHEFEPKVPMPNLSDLSHYEASATQLGGKITIGGTTVVDAVFGAAAGQQQNLYLQGTKANPIVLHGPVVVRGNVVISGYVTGQGAIYAGGNVYCPDSIHYMNPPNTPRPAGNDQASTEAWLSANWNADFLGLFARKSVSIGDCTDPTWQFYENWWMNDPMNESAEDAGLDQIPNTKVGKDGIAGTADDDVLEGDGVFTIEHYTAQDQALGLIPAGKNVGDPIPGTGEDIDGDGQYTPRTQLSDVVLSGPLTSTDWGGNLPAGGIASYHDVASLYASNMDAVFYTNHSFCWTVLGGNSATINGALVSRNENIIYGTPTMEINYDCRMLGGASGMASQLLPNTLQPIQIVRKVDLDFDPNLYAVSP